MKGKKGTKRKRAAGAEGQCARNTSVQRVARQGQPVEEELDHMQRWSMPSSATLYANLQLDLADSVLELGVGPGGSMPLLSCMLPRRASFVAVDVGKTELRGCARSLAQQRPLPPPQQRQQAVLADACALPFRGGAFDRVAAGFLLHLCRSPRAVLAEVHRALRPGGLAAFSLWGARKGSLMYSLQPKVLRKLGVSGPAATSQHPNFRLGADDAYLRDAVEGAGFSRVALWHQPSVVDSGLTGPGFVRQRLELGSEEHRGMVDAALECVLEEVGLTMAQFKKALAAADGLLARGQPLALDTIIVIARK